MHGQPGCAPLRELGTGVLDAATVFSVLVWAAGAVAVVVAVGARPAATVQATPV